MKKYLSLSLVFVASFLVSITNLKADYSDGCDHTKVYTETYYNETKWDVWVNVCDPTYVGDGFSACLETEENAYNWCKHTYRSHSYKGSYHIKTTGKCSEQSICYCNTFSVTCKLSNWCTSWKLTKDVDGDGVYDEADGDVKGDCKSWYYSYSTGSASVTVDANDTGTCATMDTKPSNDAAVAACKAAYPNRTVKSATVGDITKTAYQVTYPMYTCKSQKYLVKNMREAKYYVTSKSGDKVDVYCVNPADEAPNDTTGANEYPIEVSSCESSNSTADCGYANIMIEGRYRYDIEKNDKYNYAVIGAAMRLWGAHVNASGYSDTGIADEDDNTVPPADGLTMEDDNGDWLKFVPDDKTKEYVNVFKATYKFMLENSTVNGYRPNTDSVYDIGVGIDMLNDITCDSKNMGVFCGEGVNNNNYLYALSLYVNTVQGNPNMQDHLDELLKKDNPNYVPNNNPTGATADILVGNKVQITYSLKRDVEIDCNTLDDETANDLGCEMKQKIIIKTAQGQVIEERDSYDYCKKNYCYVVVEYDKGVITCDIAEKITIEIPNYQTCENHTKKYVSCSSSPENPTQIMYGFDPNAKCEEYEGEPIRTIETSLNCDACNDGATVDIPNCDVNKNEKYVTRTASDPSLNCILHKSSLTEETNQNGKRYYDYSNIFGVNTNICKVYCSDKVTYYMAPKQEVYSGLQLKYDIESKVFPSRAESDKSSHALTSIVQVKRDCVSEIFYENIPFDYSKNWEVAYGVKGEITNWKDLYEAVYKESVNQNNRKEVLNELIYDLYSCNFFTDNQIKSSTKVNNKNIINKPKNSKNAYSVAMKILENTQEYCNGKDCVTGKITYEGGAKYMTPNGSYLYTGQNGIDPALSSEESVFNGLNVKYCNKGECFKGSKNGKFEEDYSAANTTSESAKVEWDDSTKVSVPTNDYAIFSYSMEADLYNSTRYQIEDYTGNVTVVKENKYDENLLIMDKYLYPVADSVKNRCDKSSEKDKYVCDVNYDIRVPVITSYNKLTDFEKDKVGTIAFYRKFNNDDLTDKINTAANYTCVYTVTDKSGGEKGFAFRNIDLNNPVPVERDGTNWDASGDSAYAKYVGEVIQEIKNSGEENLYATDYYLEYSYELTPQAIDNIRIYNRDHTYYDKVIKDSCTKENNMKFNCKSIFMRELHDDMNVFEVIIYKKDGKSQYTIDKERKMQGGNE